MAKKKKSKNTSSESFKYSVELNGLLLILFGIIGFGEFGPIGKIVRYFAIFLMGTWWAIFLGGILLLGVIMLAKRNMPKFFTARLIGLYVLIICLLALAHFGYITDSEVNLKGTEIIKETIDNIGKAKEMGAPLNGGGIIGAAFIYVFTALFSNTGAYITIVILAIFGFIMLFNINMGKVFTAIFNGIKKFFGLFRMPKKTPKVKNDDVIISDSSNKDFHDDKIVITSVEELKNHPKEVKETSIENDLKELTRENEVSDDEDNREYRLPPITILDQPDQNLKMNTNEFIKKNIAILEEVFKDFGINGKVVEAHVGPAVTQFEVKVVAGTKVNSIVSIKDEIKLSLAVKEIRIQAPIPGKNTIGIEVPNPAIRPVKIREVLSTIPDDMKKYHIAVSLGIDIMGRTIVADLTKMPHLLVAGSTGSGKSVCINSFIATILMRYKPDEVKLVLVDPKKVELSNYNGIPHLLCPVVTDPKKASVALQRIVAEMDRRYNVFAECEVKNIDSYNEFVEKKMRKGSTAYKKLPYYVIIIDELADLMLIARKEVEDSIMRITQMARAAGIHLIVATQRPSVNVITGVVKTNIPSRIAFTVSSSIDSRTILDMSGAEKLLGKGDMLYHPMGENVPLRIQGSFISDDEIRRLIEFVSGQASAKFDETILEDNPNVTGTGTNLSPDTVEYEDPMYNEIVEFAIQTGKISASLLQRRFRLGYNRAARVVDLLEERGIVGPQNGSKPREVLVKLENNEE